MVIPRLLAAVLIVNTKIHYYDIILPINGMSSNSSVVLYQPRGDYTEFQEVSVLSS